MGFQLVASRLLAPVFGTTLFVWAFIISTFLSAFSAGALIGGLISRLDARRVRNAIVVIGIIGSGSLGFTAEIGRETIAYFDSMTTWMWISLGNSCLFLFFSLASAMSCVLPIMIEALTVRGARGGLSSGIVYAVITLGNIAGVMTTAFVIIPRLPTSKILVFWLEATFMCFIVIYALALQVEFRKLPLPIKDEIIDCSRACIQLRRERIGIGRGTFCVSDTRGIGPVAGVVGIGLA
jgi:hypothetical protein